MIEAGLITSTDAHSFQKMLIDKIKELHEDDYEIRGYTSMDNFDMHKYLEKIGVNEEHINWKENED